MVKNYIIEDKPSETSDAGLEAFLKRKVTSPPISIPIATIPAPSPLEIKPPSPQMPPQAEPKGSPKPYIMKNVDILNRNRQRLLVTDFADMLNELIKNAGEYGTNLAITFNDTRGEILFSNGILDQNMLKIITFETLMKKLTSFQKISGSNFNEGLKPEICG